MQIPTVCRLLVLVLFRLYAQCIDLTARAASRGATSNGGSSGCPACPDCGLFWVSFSSSPAFFVFLCSALNPPARCSCQHQQNIHVLVVLVVVFIVISVVQEIVVCKHYIFNRSILVQRLWQIYIHIYIYIFDAKQIPCSIFSLATLQFVAQLVFLQHSSFSWDYQTDFRTLVIRINWFGQNQQGDQIKKCWRKYQNNCQWLWWTFMYLFVREPLYSCECVDCGWLFPSYFSQIVSGLCQRLNVCKKLLFQHDSVDWSSEKMFYLIRKIGNRRCWALNEFLIWPILNNIAKVISLVDVFPQIFNLL